MSLYVRPMIKISAAAISSVLTSAGLAWYSYTPPDERAAEVAYYSFGGMFAILFPPAFFLFFIFGAIVSLWLDQRMKGYARWAGVKKAIVMILSYAVIGLIGGLAVSLSISQFGFMYYGIPSALLFLAVQSLLQAGAAKITSKTNHRH